MNLSDRLMKRGQRNPNNLNLPHAMMKLIYDFIRPKLVNFKTSIMGIGLILLGLNTGWQELVAFVNGGVPDHEILSMAGGNVMAGWALLMARDADRTTLESVGREALTKKVLITLPVNDQRKEGGR